MDPAIVVWHLGSLHPFEQALTIALAFGPFLLVPLVIRRRRRDAESAQPPAESAQTHGEAGT